MSQSLAKILVHTVFSTKDRRPFLRDKILREEIHHYLGGILARRDCQPIIAGGVEDHVHLLCALSRICEAATMVKEGLIKPLQGFALAVCLPRVAHSSQPWAESFNPVGIGKTSGNLPDLTQHSTGNSENNSRQSLSRLHFTSGGGAD